MTSLGPALSRRALIVGAAQATTAYAAYAATPRRSASRLAKVPIADLIPSKIADWRYVSRDGIVTATDESVPAEYDQQLMRVYEAPDRPRIMLLIAYGSTQGGSLQLHRPETCFPGQGFGLEGFRNLAIPVPASPAMPARLVQGRGFTARRDDRVERLIYWTRIADSFPLNTLQEYRAILGSVLGGTIPDGILVRVSTLWEDVAESDRALEQFAAAMISSAPAARALLVGGPAPASLLRAPEPASLLRVPEPSSLLRVPERG